jgi:hypothetical protein
MIRALWSCCLAISSLACFGQTVMLDAVVPDNDTVVVRKTAADAGEAVAVLHEGELLRLVCENSGWCKGEGEDALHGYVRREQLLPLAEFSGTQLTHWMDSVFTVWGTTIHKANELGRQGRFAELKGMRLNSLAYEAATQLFQEEYCQKQDRALLRSFMLSIDGGNASEQPGSALVAALRCDHRTFLTTLNDLDAAQQQEVRDRVLGGLELDTNTDDPAQVKERERLLQLLE